MFLVVDQLSWSGLIWNNLSNHWFKQETRVNINPINSSLKHSSFNQWLNNILTSLTSLCLTSWSSIIELISQLYTQQQQSNASVMLKKLFECSQLVASGEYLVFTLSFDLILNEKCKDDAGSELSEFTRPDWFIWFMINIKIDWVVQSEAELVMMME